MTAAVLRNEIHDIIDAIPEQSLPAIKPLLTHLAYDYWKPVIEAASPEEIAMIDKYMNKAFKYNLRSLHSANWVIVIFSRMLFVFSSVV